LFGGGANLKRLIESLKSELEIDIEIGDALKDIKALSGVASDREDAGSRFNLAIGAALNKKDKINLLPIELKEKTRRYIENVSLKGIVAGVIVSLLLFYTGLHVKLHGLNKRMSALKLEERTLAPQLNDLRSKMSISSIFKNKPYWEDALKEISNVVPPEIYLTYLSADEDMMNIEGDILRVDQGSQEILSRFMMTLEEGIFENVSLIKTQKKPGNSAIDEFEITCTVE